MNWLERAVGGGRGPGKPSWLRPHPPAALNRTDTCAQRGCMMHEGVHEHLRNWCTSGHVNEWANMCYWVSQSMSDQMNKWMVKQINKWIAELHRSPRGSSLCLEWPASHRGLLRVTKMRTLRMAIRRSLREVMARMVSWARFSNGRTASSHQHQAGPQGLACRTENIHTVLENWALKRAGCPLGIFLKHLHIKKKKSDFFRLV